MTDRLPVMCGFQAAGAAPLVLGHKVEAPETIATAIRIGNPARGDEALAAARDSGGFIDLVTDDEILAAYKLVAATEGVFCEPASAASIAGLRKARERRPHRRPAPSSPACSPATASRTPTRRCARPRRRCSPHDPLAEIERRSPCAPVVA